VYPQVDKTETPQSTRVFKIPGSLQKPHLNNPDLSNPDLKNPGLLRALFVLFLVAQREKIARRKNPDLKTPDLKNPHRPKKTHLKTPDLKNAGLFRKSLLALIAINERSCD
jgi:hypothetical protein